MSMSKPNAAKRFPFFEKEFYGRLFSLNANLAIPENVAHVIEQLLKPRGINLIGRAGSRDQIVELSFADISGLLPLDKEVILMFLAESKSGIPLEISLFWYPPAVFDAFVSPRVRLELSMGFPKGWKYQETEELFCSAVEALLPHWGELNQLEITKFPTLCTLSGHHYCVPHLGTTNYFGREYCEFFGGTDKITSAGFQRVSHLCDGMLVSLGLDLTEEAYQCLRGEVEMQLAPLNAFDPDAVTIMPRFKSV